MAGRTGLGRRAALAGLAASAGALAAASGRAETRTAGAVFAYVGGYTPEAGGGIHVLRFDAATGRLEPQTVVGGIANPTWLVIDAPRRRLFAMSETGDYGPDRTGSVTAFAIGADGALERLGTAGTGAAGPAHVGLHPSGRWLAAADYGGGAVALLPVGEDGRPGEPVQVERMTPRPAPPSPAPGQDATNFGESDHRAPHMHMADFDPAGRFLLACDAGSDRIYVWRLDASAGRLLPARVPFVATPPGSAPRHFAFGRDGRFLHVLQEHDGLVATYRYDPAEGGLELLRRTPTLPPGYAGSDLASEIALSRDGRFLYAANRLRDTVTTFACGPGGALRRVGETWTQSDYPRSFGLSPDGRWLVSCNQRGDDLTTFRIDPATGVPVFSGAFTPVRSPAAIVFAAPPG